MRGHRCREISVKFEGLTDTGTLMLWGLGAQRCGDTSLRDSCGVWRIQGHKGTDSGESPWGLGCSGMWGHHPMGVHVRFEGLTDTGTVTLQGLGGSEMWGHHPLVPVGVGVCRDRATMMWGDPCRVWSAQGHCPRMSLWGLGSQGCRDMIQVGFL